MEATTSVSPSQVPASDQGSQRGTSRQAYLQLVHSLLSGPQLLASYLKLAPEALALLTGSLKDEKGIAEVGSLL